MGNSPSGSMVTRFFDLAGFAAHLHAVSRDMDRLGPAIIRHAVEAVCNRAKAAIGTYDFDWHQLSPSTIADRVHKGFTPNDPLLRTGELRDSIQFTISHNGLEAGIGSDNDKAVWAELGTSRAPPRPFLEPALRELEPRIIQAAAKATVAVLMGRGLMSAEMRELLELLHPG